MLVYTRSVTDQNGSEKPRSQNEPTLPSHLESFVHENNEKFENWIVSTKLSNVSVDPQCDFAGIAFLLEKFSSILSLPGE